MKSQQSPRGVMWKGLSAEFHNYRPMRPVKGCFMGNLFFFLNYKQPSIKILFLFFYLVFYTESGKLNEVKDLY